MLTEQDYENAAEALGCDVAAVKAVTEVESRGSGFLPDGRPKILFEAAVFSRLTNHKYDATNPDISSRGWNRSLYKGGAAEYDRLNAAQTLDNDAALEAASYGLFQIMGFNYAAAGFGNIQDYVEAMARSESEHLKAFVNFIKSKRLHRFLANKEWARFAAGYNGGGYAQNKYDQKLEAAYKRFLVSDS